MDSVRNTTAAAHPSVMLPVSQDIFFGYFATH
jgi:hypothetical protein